MSQLILYERSVDPPVPAIGGISIYASSDKTLYYKDDANTIHHIGDVATGVNQSVQFGTVTIGNATSSAILTLNGSGSAAAYITMKKDSNTFGFIGMQSAITGPPISDNLVIFTESGKDIRFMPGGNAVSKFDITSTENNMFQRLLVYDTIPEIVRVVGNNIGGGYMTFRDSNAGADRGYIGYGGSSILTGSTNADMLLRGEDAIKFAIGNAMKGRFNVDGLFVPGRIQTLAPGQSNTINIGQLSDSPGYSLIGFNDVSTATGHAGIFGGGGASNLYISAPLTNKIEFRIAGIGAGSFEGDAFKVVKGIRARTTAHSWAVDEAITGYGLFPIVGHQSNSTVPSLVCWSEPNSGDNSFVGFYSDGTGIARGLIDFNRAAVQTRYNVTSDANLKVKLGPMKEQGERLDRIQLHEYMMKETNYITDGPFAQELYAEYPDAVSIGYLGQPWGVDRSFLIWPMLKEIQSLRARLRVAGIP